MTSLLQHGVDWIVTLLEWWALASMLALVFLVAGCRRHRPLQRANASAVGGDAFRSDD